MCSQLDTPPYDEPLEDMADWAELRHRRIEREEHASAAERQYGLPQRPGYIEVRWDQLRAVEARRGWEWDPQEREDYMARRRIDETGE